MESDQRSDANRLLKKVLSLAGSEHADKLPPFPGRSPEHALARMCEETQAPSPDDLRRYRAALVEILARPPQGKDVPQPVTENPDQRLRTVFRENQDKLERGIGAVYAGSRIQDVAAGVARAGGPDGIVSVAADTSSTAQDAATAAALAGELARMSGGDSNRDRLEFVHRLRAAGSGGMAREAADVVLRTADPGATVPERWQDSTRARIEERLLTSLEIGRRTTDGRPGNPWEAGTGAVRAALGEAEKCVEEHNKPRNAALSGLTAPGMSASTSSSAAQRPEQHSRGVGSAADRGVNLG